MRSIIHMLFISRRYDIESISCEAYRRVRIVIFSSSWHLTGLKWWKKASSASRKGILAVLELSMDSPWRFCVSADSNLSLISRGTSRSRVGRDISSASGSSVAIMSRLNSWILSAVSWCCSWCRVLSWVWIWLQIGPLTRGRITRNDVPNIQFECVKHEGNLQDISQGNWWYHWRSHLCVMKRYSLCQMNDLRVHVDVVYDVRDESIALVEFGVVVEPVSAFLQGESEIPNNIC